VRTQADPGRIEQVLGNLLANALRHAPRGTAIDVRLEVRAGKARIEIADQGEGITSEALPFVFERFYRADRARSREHGGTGLGLAISRQIVQAHGGTISLPTVLKVNGVHCRTRSHTQAGHLRRRRRSIGWGIVLTRMLSGAILLL
jgi:signal transduction histidine kinase